MSGTRLLTKDCFVTSLITIWFVIVKQHLLYVWLFYCVQLSFVHAVSENTVLYCDYVSLLLILDQNLWDALPERFRAPRFLEPIGIGLLHFPWWSCNVVFHRNVMWQLNFLPCVTLSYYQHFQLANITVDNNPSSQFVHHSLECQYSLWDVTKFLPSRSHFCDHFKD